MGEEDKKKEGSEDSKDEKAEGGGDTEGKNEDEVMQGCIICSILPSGMGARGLSLEHVENIEMFFCSPTLI